MKINLESGILYPRDFAKFAKFLGFKNQDSEKHFLQNLESWISNPGNFASLQSFRHIMCRLVRHPEVYFKPWENIQHSRDFKILSKQLSAHELWSFFKAKSSNICLAKPYFFKDYIPYITWHYFAQSPKIKECSTSLKGIWGNFQKDLQLCKVLLKR